MGDDHIVFGSDSLWYGGPGWQINALWRSQIPEAIREKWDYPELTTHAKRKILGLNSARLYGLPRATSRYSQGDLANYATAPELQPGGRVDAALQGVGYPTPVVPASTPPEDRFSKLKGWMDELALGRSNTRNGWFEPESRVRPQGPARCRPFFMAERSASREPSSTAYRRMPYRDDDKILAFPTARGAT